MWNASKNFTPWHKCFEGFKELVLPGAKNNALTEQKCFVNFLNAVVQYCCEVAAVQLYGMELETEISRDLSTPLAMARSQIMTRISDVVASNEYEAPLEELYLCSM
jgi:hypothetical protein